MDSSEQALQTNGKIFQISNFWPKTENFSNEQRGVNIDQSAKCVVYQWIRHNNHYKIRYSVFQIRF